MNATARCKVAEKEIKPGDEVILFTYSPNPNRKYWSRDQMKNYKIHIRNYFSQFPKCFKRFAMCPELNLQGNIHYHGWYVVKDHVKWLKHLLPSMKFGGFFKANKLVDKDKGLKYYTKDLCKKLFEDDYASITNVNAYMFKKPVTKLRAKHVMKEMTDLDYEEVKERDKKQAEENMKLFLQI